MSKKLDEQYKKMDEKKQKMLQLRHTTEHVLHTAMQKLYPELKKAMGPATDDGFYFDFDYGQKISEENFPAIEKEMARIIKSGSLMKKVEMSIDEAREVFAGIPYKLEWLDEIEERGEKVSTYQMILPSGKVIDEDLCSGPHLDSVSEIGAFKLLSVAGAYWHGDEKNKMLTRIYGTAFYSQEELDEYMRRMEIARQNDHRKLGQELDLFCFSDLVGKGLVMYTPRGTIIKNELQKAILDACKEFGAQEVNIPHMAKIELYETSGHAEKFKDELFVVKSHYKEEFVLKPVNCPHHTQIYASRPRSYKDLPIAYIESTQQHRDEKPGAIGGLNRSRSFEIDDGHTFCTKEQIKDEVIKLIKAAEKFYKQLGMWEDHWVSLSFKNPETPEKYIGDEKDWEMAQKMLVEVDGELGLGGKIMEGEAALYGPKIDIMMRDVLGNDVQLGTFQIDFAMPKRFGLTFTDKNGKEQTPIMIHRAILGSYGRFIANLLERTGGALPLWLSPVQVAVLPVSEKTIKYAEKTFDELKKKGVRVELNKEAESLGKKIRNAEAQKIPYMVIIGEKEAESGQVSVRQRGQKDLGSMELAGFASRVLKEEKEKSV